MQRDRAGAGLAAAVRRRQPKIIDSLRRPRFQRLALQRARPGLLTHEPIALFALGHHDGDPRAVQRLPARSRLALRLQLGQHPRAERALAVVVRFGAAFAVVVVQPTVAAHDGLVRVVGQSQARLPASRLVAEVQHFGIETLHGALDRKGVDHQRGLAGALLALVGQGRRNGQKQCQNCETDGLGHCVAPGLETFIFGIQDFRRPWALTIMAGGSARQN